MNALTFPEILRETADALGVMPRHEVAALLRRAALLIENISPVTRLEPVFEEALEEVAIELGVSREEAVRIVVRDWLVAIGSVQIGTIEEDGEVAGNA